MDVNNYIESGIIEAYVLGLATHEEQQELELLCIKHPEIKQAITDFEISMENEALNSTALAHPHLKDAIWKKINEIEAPIIPISKTQAPNHKTLTAAPKSIKWLRGAIAASIILLLSSILLNFYYYGQYKSTIREVNALVNYQKQKDTENTAIQASVKMACDPMVRKISMGGTAGWEHCKATLFWDSKTNDVYIIIDEPHEMPKTMELQLWAIKNGKPLNAGIIKENKNFVMIKMGNIKDADSFALTLEQKDRKDTNIPDMNNVHIMGKI